MSREDCPRCGSLRTNGEGTGDLGYGFHTWDIWEWTCLECGLIWKQYGEGTGDLGYRIWEEGNNESNN